jgi:hypothetical protein
MSEDDSEFGPTSLRNQLLKVFFDRTDAAGRQESGATTSEPDRHLYRKLIAAQALWMVLAFILLYTFDEWSPTTYYIIIFNGLLCVRLVFAPTTSTPRWWRRLNWVVYGGFIVLLYIIITEYIQYVG